MRRDEGFREAFLRFLLDAKRFTYASQGDEATVTPLIPGSKQLEHRDGDFRYRDYMNESHGDVDAFWGIERITRNGEEVYELRYSGGFLA